MFKRCNSYGLPIYAVGATSLFSLLAYLSVTSSAGTVFNWLISLTNTAGYTSWIVCSIIFLRFRKACAVQGVTVTYQSKFQPYGAYICLIVFTVLLLCNGFTLFYPGQFTASGFLTTYLGIPIFVALWLGHKVIEGRSDSWLIRPHEVDMTTGLAEVEADAETWDRLEMAKEGDKRDVAWWKKLNCLWA